MGIFSDAFFFIINNVIFALTSFIFTVYLILAAVSAVVLRNYLRKNSFVDYTGGFDPVKLEMSVIPDNSRFY